MERAFRDLIEFDRADGKPLSDRAPGDGVTDEVYKLRYRLIDEGCADLLFAMNKHDVPGIAYGIADLIYVALGTALAYGIDIVPIFNAVHAAKMKKFGPDPSRDADDKVRKSLYGTYPDIAGILSRQPPLAEIYGEDTPADAVYQAMRSLTNDERLEVMRDFCAGCGRDLEGGAVRCNCLRDD